MTLNQYVAALIKNSPEPVEWPKDATWPGLDSVVLALAKKGYSVTTKNGEWVAVPVRRAGRP